VQRHECDRNVRGAILEGQQRGIGNEHRHVWIGCPGVGHQRRRDVERDDVVPEGF
jgi:hypothetical protein